MLINSSNYEDIRKYFLHTFVKVQEYNDQLFYVKQVDPAYVYLESTDQQIDFRIDLTKDYNLNYIIPRKTVYQFNNVAACLARIPARQFKKGLCKQNTQISLLGATGWGPIEFSMTTIEAFINKPAYMSVAQFMEVSGEVQSAALSPRFAVSRGGAVYLDTTLVAKANFETKIVTTRKVFEPDIAKLFPNFEKKVLK